MKYGIVLEGGALRGLFTAGVLDVFMENGIAFDGAVGVSAGACFGCNIKSGQIGRSIRYNLRFANDKRYCSVDSLVRTGDMFGAEFCYHTIPDKLDIFDKTAFESSPMEFWVVATDVKTGKAVYHRMDHVSYDELEWIRASSSLPLAARMVDVGGRRMMDGGISDSIPLRFMESVGYQKNVVILTQPRGYVKKPTKAVPMLKIGYRKYPNLVRACAERHRMYNKELRYIRKAEELGSAFVIAPSEKLPISHVEHDPEILQEVYRMGRKAAMDKLEEVKVFLYE
ncbi:MAG: patatin family protein [Ruminococcus sp.]|nr:patatin family protein [Ruminococcus sp.]